MTDNISRSCQKQQPRPNVSLQLSDSPVYLTERAAQKAVEILFESKALVASDADGIQHLLKAVLFFLVTCQHQSDSAAFEIKCWGGALF